MGNMYDTRKLAERPLDIESIQLPEGMGIGALRHTIAAGVRNHWDDIRTIGPDATILARPADFLGAAANVEDLADANAEKPLPYGVLESLNKSTHIWLKAYDERERHIITLNHVQDCSEDMIRNELAHQVAWHVLWDIIRQTGLDPESADGSTSLQAWGVK